MAGEVLLVTQFLASGLMLLLAGWLLYLNFHSRVVRAFSLFLLLRALQILMNQFSRLLGPPLDAAFWLGMRGYVDLAILPVLAYFLLAYARVRSRAAEKWVGWGLIGLVFAVETAYAVDHCVSLCVQGTVAAVGPLGVLGLSHVLAYAVLALALANVAVRAQGKAARSAAFLVSAAFFLNAVFDAGLFLSSIGLGGDLQDSLDKEFARNAWQWTPFWIVLASCVPIAWTAERYLRRRVSVHKRHAVTVLLVAAGEALVGLGIALMDPQPGTAASVITQSLIGATRALFPAFVVLAILRHRLFGLDVRIRSGISRGTVASIIIASFFAVSKVVENLVAAQPWADGNTGIYVGGVVAGLLLFALSPLQRVGERVAQAAVPNVLSKDRAERVRFYREQAEIAWSDGAMGRRERLLLDQLRDRLGLTAEEASAIERRLLAPDGPDSKRKADAPVLG